MTHPKNVQIGKFKRQWVDYHWGEMFDAAMLFHRCYIRWGMQKEAEQALSNAIGFASIRKGRG